LIGSYVSPQVSGNGGGAGAVGGHLDAFGFPEELVMAPDRKAGADRQGARGGRTGTFQMSSAYSRMVRSEENFPVRATLRMAIRVQRSGSW